MILFLLCFVVAIKYTFAFCRMIELQQKLKDRIRTAARELFGVEVQQPAAEVPPRPELGDLAFPVSFELAT